MGASCWLFSPPLFDFGECSVWWVVLFDLELVLVLVFFLLMFLFDYSPNSYISILLCCLRSSRFGAIHEANV